MENQNVLDLTDIQRAAFLLLHNVEPQLIRGRDGRVVFRVLVDQEVQRLLLDYERNPQVKLLDFVGVLKRLRGRMIDARDGRNGHEYGQGDVNGNRREG